MPTPEKLKELLHAIEKSKILKSIKDLQSEYQEIQKQFPDYLKKEELENTISDIVSRVQNLIRIPEDGKSPTEDELLNLIKPLIPQPIKGDKGDTTIVEKVIETIVEKQPIITNEVKEVAITDAPEIIKEKLDSIDYLKGLEREIEKLRKEVGRKTIMGGGAGATGGHVVKAYDLSAVLNGSTKIFSLPAFWRVISVVSSSFPNAFRPTVDYTVDGSAFTITFTSEIDASSTLSSGQTIIITYSE